MFKKKEITLREQIIQEEAFYVNYLTRTKREPLLEEFEQWMSKVKSLNDLNIETFFKVDERQDFRVSLLLMIANENEKLTQKIEFFKEFNTGTFERKQWDEYCNLIKQLNEKYKHQEGIEYLNEKNKIISIYVSRIEKYNEKNNDKLDESIKILKEKLTHFFAQNNLVEHDEYVSFLKNGLEISDKHKDKNSIAYKNAHREILLDYTNRIEKIKLDSVKVINTTEKKPRLNKDKLESILIERIKNKQQAVEFISHIIEEYSNKSVEADIKLDEIENKESFRNIYRKRALVVILDIMDKNFLDIASVDINFFEKAVVFIDEVIKRHALVEIDTKILKDKLSFYKKSKDIGNETLEKISKNQDLVACIAGTEFIYHFKKKDTLIIDKLIKEEFSVQKIKIFSLAKNIGMTDELISRLIKLETVDKEIFKLVNKETYFDNIIAFLAKADRNHADNLQLMKILQNFIVLDDIKKVFRELDRNIVNIIVSSQEKVEDFNSKEFKEVQILDKDKLDFIRNVVSFGTSEKIASLVIHPDVVKCTKINMDNFEVLWQLKTTLPDFEITDLILEKLNDLDYITAVNLQLELFKQNIKNSIEMQGKRELDPVEKVELIGQFFKADKAHIKAYRNYTLHVDVSNVSCELITNIMENSDLKEMLQNENDTHFSKKIMFLNYLINNENRVEGQQHYNRALEALKVCENLPEAAKIFNEIKDFFEKNNDLMDDFHQERDTFILSAIPIMLNNRKTEKNKWSAMATLADKPECFANKKSFLQIFVEWIKSMFRSCANSGKGFSSDEKGRQNIKNSGIAKSEDSIFNTVLNKVSNENLKPFEKDDVLNNKFSIN